MEIADAIMTNLAEMKDCVGFQIRLLPFTICLLKCLWSYDHMTYGRTTTEHVDLQA